jgi:hypothetical protein
VAGCAGLDAHDVDGFVSYANDLSEGLAVGAALGVREIRWSTMVWGGGGGGVAAAVNAAAAAVASGQAEHVIVYCGLTEADDGRQSYGKGHFPPLLSAHGVLTPAQVCALRTQRMLEVDRVPRSALEALVQASYHHAQQNPDAVAYGRPLDHDSYAGPAGSPSPCACTTAPGRMTGPRPSWSLWPNGPGICVRYPRTWHLGQPGARSRHIAAARRPGGTAGQRDRLRLPGYGLTFRAPWPAGRAARRPDHWASETSRAAAFAACAAELAEVGTGTGSGLHSRSGPLPAWRAGSCPSAR